MGKTKKHGGRHTAADLVRLVQRAVEKQDFKEALKSAKACWRLDASDEHRRLLEQAWLARGLQLARAGFAAEARAAAQELMALGVSEPAVRQGLPDLLIAVGLYDQAVASGKVPGGIECSDSVTLTRAADRAVADPATAPASLGGIREGAAAVRAALDAIYAGDESAALAALNEIPRQSPFAEWKLFVRGLAAYYRQDADAMQANWDRLATDRFAARLAASLRRLSDPSSQAGDRTEFRAALRVLEKDLLGDTVIWCLESLQKSLGADRWREAVFAMRRWKKDFQVVPGLTERVERFFYDTAVRKANRRWLDDLAAAVEPPWWDPRWNRARAVICEDDEESSLQEADEFWQSYLDDLPGISELKPGERSLAQAMVWERVGINCLAGAESAESSYDEDLERYGEDAHEFQQRQLKTRESLRQRVLECLNEAISLAPAYAAPYHHLAKALADWKQEDSAAAAYRRMLAHVPDDFDAIVALARHHACRDEAAAARDYALQARALKPANKEVLAMVAAARFAAARIFSAEGRFDEARVELSAIDSDGGAQTLPAYDVTVARAMVEHMAARPETARQLVEQALAQADDPADVFMLLTIEADRHDLPFQLNDLPSQYRQQWESSLKKRRSRAAGSMARRIMDFMAELQEFKGNSGFLNGYLERVLKYVTGCNRIRWDAEDLLHVCQFLDRVVDDPNYRAERTALLKLLDRGRKKFPQEPMFHLLRGKVEIGRGPYKCDRGLARRCLESALETAKASTSLESQAIHEAAAERLRFLDSHGAGPRRRPFRPPSDAAQIPPEIFDDVPSDELAAAVVEMSRALGLDPETMLDEIKARLGARASGCADDRAENAATTGVS